MKKINFSKEKKYVVRRRVALVLILLFLITLTNQAFSFVSAKVLDFSDYILESRIENTKEKINNGDLEIKSYIVSKGEKLWDIAENIIADAGINVDTRDAVNVIENINKAMNVDVSVLQPGQEIYIPVDLEEAL